MQIPFFVQVLVFAIPLGFFISILITIGLLLYTGRSPKAWTLSAAAAIVFFIAGSINGMWAYDGTIVVSLASIIGPIGGYFLIALALLQYNKDWKKKTGSNDVSPAL